MTNEPEDRLGSNSRKVDEPIFSRNCEPYECEPYECELNELLQRASSGDANALAELIGASRDYLLLIANQELDRDLNKKLGPSDIVQSAMLAIHQNFDQFRGASREAFYGWIRQILLRGVHQARRKFKAADKRDIRREIAIQQRSAETFNFLEPSGGDLTPHSHAVHSEEKRILTHALSRLSSDHQQVIAWRNHEQLSFAEIGRRLDRSEAASQKLWTRAVANLKQELAALGFVSGEP